MFIIFYRLQRQPDTSLTPSTLLAHFKCLELLGCNRKVAGTDCPLECDCNLVGYRRPEASLKGDICDACDEGAPRKYEAVCMLRTSSCDEAPCTHYRVRCSCCWEYFVGVCVELHEAVYARYVLVRAAHAKNGESPFARLPLELVKLICAYFTDELRALPDL